MSFEPWLAEASQEKTAGATLAAAAAVAAMSMARGWETRLR
jgi:hypothetical protein